MKEIQVPDWFDIDRYKLGETGEKEMHESMLAVLDRVALYRVAVDPTFDAVGVGEAITAEAMQVLQAWSYYPYRRIDEESRSVLLDALPVTSHCSRVDEEFNKAIGEEAMSATNDALLKTFEKILDEAAARERDDCQRELHQIVMSVAHLPANEQWEAVEKQVRERRTWEEQSGEGADLLELVAPNRMWKLLEYRAAAYMDLTLWRALVGNVPTPSELKNIHDNLWPDGPDWRSIAELLKQLKDMDLGFHTRIDEGGLFRARQRSHRRRKGRT